MITRHQIYFQDSKNMEALPSGTVDLVVTSPPYPMIEMWDSIFAGQNVEISQALQNGDGPAAFEMMHVELDAVWQEVWRILKQGGIACINVGDATRTIDSRFWLYPNHSRILNQFLKLGFQALPAILWRKQTNAPNKFMGSGMLPPSAYVTLEHEYILILRKGPKREFKLEAEKQNRRESAFFWEERNAWFSDIWMDLKGASQNLGDRSARLRSAAFLRRRHLRSGRGQLQLLPGLRGAADHRNQLHGRCGQRLRRVHGLHRRQLFRRSGLCRTFLRRRDLRSGRGLVQLLGRLRGAAGHGDQLYGRRGQRLRRVDGLQRRGLRRRPGVCADVPAGRRCVFGRRRLLPESLPSEGRQSGLRLID